MRLSRARSTAFISGTVHVVLAENPTVMEEQLRGGEFGQVRRTYRAADG